MVSQVHRIGCLWKTSFRKSGHIFVLVLNATKFYKSYIIMITIMIDKVVAKHFLFNTLFYRQNEIFISDSLRHSNHVTKEFEMPQNSNGCGV